MFKVKSAQKEEKGQKGVGVWGEPPPRRRMQKKRKEWVFKVNHTKKKNAGKDKTGVGVLRWATTKKKKAEKVRKWLDV